MIFNSLEYALFLPVAFFVSVIFFRGDYQEFIYFQF